MTSDNRDKNSEQHSKYKWRDHKPTKLTIALAGVVIYMFFISADAHEFWPSWPLFAVTSGVLVSIAALYLEAFVIEGITFDYFLIGSAICVVAGVLVYVFVPRNAPLVPPQIVVNVSPPPPASPPQPDVEVIGTLQPGNELAPAGACAANPADPNSWVLLIGTAGIIFNGPIDFPFLTVGNCPVLTISRDSSGVSVSADLFDDGGRLIATIKNNEFHAISGTSTRVERDHDLSKLVIMQGQQELLFVNYLNKSTVRVRGVFGCPGHHTVPVRDNQPVPGFHMGGCATIAKGVHMGTFIGVQ
jgi:hypothetical protein